jgi:hypothetical protein
MMTKKLVSESKFQYNVCKATMYYFDCVDNEQCEMKIYNVEQTAIRMCRGQAIHKVFVDML